MTAYSLFGFPLPEADVRAVDDGVTVMQDDGQPVVRWRTESLPPPAARCKCSHGRSAHTRGTDQCWSAVCGCRSYRPEETA